MDMKKGRLIFQSSPFFFGSNHPLLPECTYRTGVYIID
jgi:hypothetical protein